MKKSFSGFTLLELVLTVLIIGILATMTVILVDPDAEKYELTKKKMARVREAIVGNESLVDSQGRRTSFGYHGDMGRLPELLSSLINSQSPTWLYNTPYQFGAGWRGPYYQADSDDYYAIDKDAWGRSFAYSTSASPPSITSYGADGIAGGNLYSSDIVVQFTANSRLASVRGRVQDASTNLGGRTVEMRYPVDGAMAIFATSTDTNGLFSFFNVPFGIRSIALTDSPTRGPFPVVIESPQTMVGNDLLNYLGTLQGITVDTSSVACSGVRKHSINVISSYASDVTLAHSTTFFDDQSSSLLLYTIALNSVNQPIAAGGTYSGVVFDIANALTIKAASTAPLQLTFENDMSDKQVALDMQWTTTQKRDSLTWHTQDDCLLPPISIINAQTTSTSAASTTITLSYTVPADAGKFAELVVSSCGEKYDRKAETGYDFYYPAGASFNGISMDEVVVLESNTNNADNIGIGMYRTHVNANDTGTITVSWNYAMTRATLHALVLTSTDDSTPNPVKTDSANGSATSNNINPALDGGMVITFGCSSNANQVVANDTKQTILNHVEIAAQMASAQGYIGPIDPRANQTGVGFNSSSPGRIEHILAAFLPP